MVRMRIHQVMFSTEHAAEMAKNALRREGLAAVRVVGTLVCIPDEHPKLADVIPSIAAILRDFGGSGTSA
jgi:hypothetical protein